jgi:hypothetical protein
MMAELCQADADVAMIERHARRLFIRAGHEPEEWPREAERFRKTASIELRFTNESDPSPASVWTLSSAISEIERLRGVGWQACEPTPEMIEAGAKAAWVDYTGRDGSNEFKPDTWPDTRLYPNANDFRLAAKACYLAMIKVRDGGDRQ